MNKAILINPEDNVATATDDIKRGSVDVIGLGNFVVSQDIPMGHKFAIKDISKGEAIIKYNVPIGFAVSDITAGEYVHIHNLKSITDTRSNDFTEDALPSDMSYELKRQ